MAHRAPHLLPSGRASAAAASREVCGSRGHCQDSSRSSRTHYVGPRISPCRQARRLQHVSSNPRSGQLGNHHLVPQSFSLTTWTRPGSRTDDGARPLRAFGSDVRHGMTAWTLERMSSPDAGWNAPLALSTLALVFVGDFAVRLVRFGFDSGSVAGFGSRAGIGTSDTVRLALGFVTLTDVVLFRGLGTLGRLADRATRNNASW